MTSLHNTFYNGVNLFTGVKLGLKITCESGVVVGV